MPISYRSAADLATEYIRDLIHSGRLEPGKKIVVDELTADMEVSRTPVRDALKRLEGEGLVEIVPRVGAYVRRIPVSEILEVYAIKQLLDPLLVFWATQRASEEERKTFVASAARLANLAMKADVEAYIDLVEQRRGRMLEIVRSDVLRKCFQAIDGRARWLRHQNLAQPGRMKQSIAEHRDVARAIAKGDAERAATLTAEHVRSATRSLAALIAPSLDDTMPPGAPLDWRQAKKLLDPIS